MRRSQVLPAAAMAIALWAVGSGCAGRAIAVESAPRGEATATLTVTNSLSQAVNVYLVSGGSDHFLKQVAANTTESLAVQTVPLGATVQLRATTQDGSRSYSRDGVVLAAQNTWRIP